MEKISELSLWTKWKRPASVPYPNTWHRFTTKSKDGKTFNIKIVDLTPDRFEESIELMKNHYYPYEPVSLSVKLSEDEISYENNLHTQRIISQQNMSIIAVLDEDVPKPEIVGLQKLLVLSKDDDPAPNMPGIALRKKNKLFADLKRNHDTFKIFNTDKFIEDFGLCVKTEYRGLNIGYNIVATFEKLARAFGIEVAVMGCNSIQAQVIAERVGFKTLNEIVYSDYKDDQGRVVCPVVGTKSTKRMAIKYNIEMN